jgi:hypothetical protein
MTERCKRCLRWFQGWSQHALCAECMEETTHADEPI